MSIARTLADLLDTGGDIKTSHLDNVTPYSKPSTEPISYVSGLQAALDTKTTPSYVDTKVAALVDSSPATLDTLNELAAALGDDANHVTTMTNLIGTKQSASGDYDVGDNVKIKMGTGDDLQIYHNPSNGNSYIHETGGGDLLLQGVDVKLRSSYDGANMLHGVENGAVTIYHNGNPKLATTSSGIDVTGTVTADGLTLSSGTDIKQDDTASSIVITGGNVSNVGANMLLYGSTHATNANVFRIRQGAVERLRITSTGNVEMSGNLDVTGSVTADGLTVDGVANISSSTNSPLILTSTYPTGGYTEYQLGASGATIGYLGSAASLVSGGSAADLSIRSQGNLVFSTGGNSERLKITSTGNVLVGKTATDNTTAGLRIAPTGFTSIVTSNDYPLLLNRLSSDGALLTFRKDSTTVGGIGVDGGSLVIGGGDVGIGFYQVADALVPYNGTSSTRDAAIDLGMSSARYKDLYLSGNVEMGGNLDVDGDGKATRIVGRGIIESSSGFSGDTFAVMGVNTSNASGSHGAVFASKHADSNALLVGSHDSAFNSLVVKGSGNVGVGTSSPSAKLDVAGDIGLRTNLAKGGSSGTHPLGAIADGQIIETPMYIDYQYLWSGNARTHTTELTCGSYAHFEITYVQTQSNGGGDTGQGIHRYIRGIWANNHTTHTWNVLEQLGGGGTVSITISVGQDTTSNSGKLTITEVVGTGSYSWSKLQVRTYYGGHAIAHNET